MDNVFLFFCNEFQEKRGNLFRIHGFVILMKDDLEMMNVASSFESCIFLLLRHIHTGEIQEFTDSGLFLEYR